MKQASVAILMACYKPNMSYLRQQLICIKNQSYKNLKLFVLDDSDDLTVFTSIKDLIQELHFEFDIYIDRNKSNLGANLSFEKLTKWADANFFAYCDQDDVWAPHKIETLLNILDKPNKTLAYSDMRIIDKNNNVLHPSFFKMSRVLKPVKGTNSFAHLLLENSITGCTLIIKSDIAKAAIPFNHSYVHDHWLSLFASTKGELIFVDEPLVNYRMHESNQIGSAHLPHLENKTQYYERVILKNKRRIYNTLDRFDDKNKLINQLISFYIERENCYIGKKSRILQYFLKYPKIILFEYILFKLPEKYSNYILNKLTS